MGQTQIRFDERVQPRDSDRRLPGFQGSLHEPQVDRANDSGTGFREIEERCGRSRRTMTRIPGGRLGRYARARGGWAEALCSSVGLVSRRLESLITVLDPNVVLRSDGGSRVRAACNPVVGADRVARFLLGALSMLPSLKVIEQQTHDGLGFVRRLEGRAVGVITLEVIDGMITHERMVLNPDKLSMWA